MEQKRWTASEEGSRLDKTISKLDDTLSRMAVQRLIEEKKIKVNGIVQKPSYIVKLGDEISIEKEDVKDVQLKPQEIPLEIVYEDNDIIVVNKPKGLVVHPRKW